MSDSPRQATTLRRTVGFAAWCIALFACVLQTPRVAFAHHSASLSDFDAKNPVTLAGTVVEFRLINPHSSIAFDVSDEQGNVRRWHIELGSASALRKAGWTNETMRFGQRIVVVAAPAKDGSAALSAQHEARITLPDTNAVIYDAGRPAWLSIFRLFSR